MKRVIQQRLANPLATQILDGRLESGSSIEIDWKDDDFTFSPLNAANR